MKAKQEIRVNTLIIGAGRSGTTTLWSFMKDHDDICFSYIKEVPFFSLLEHYSRGENYYHSFFRSCGTARVIASSDSHLLMDHEAISRIYSYNPEMKIIALLREPVSRAYSSYNYSLHAGHHQEYSSFLDSLEAEREIVQEADIIRRNNLGHFYGSLYHEHLSRWTAVFPREQLLLLKTSDLQKFPDKLAGELCTFLDLAPFAGKIGWVNAAAAPKNKKLERLFTDRGSLTRRILRKMLPQKAKHWIMSSGLPAALHKANKRQEAGEKLSPGDENTARAYFRDDLRLLQQDFGITF